MTTAEHQKGIMGLRQERMLASPRYKDGLFHNAAPVSMMKKESMLGTTMDFIFGGAKRKPRAPLPVESPLATWARPIETGLRATWLGHSTVLLELDGLKVLTDPVLWSERISPVSFAGPKRFHEAPAALAELPQLDAVLISHDHYDHLDFPSVRQLAQLQPNVPFITSLGVGARLESIGIPAERIFELDWWEEKAIKGLRFTATPAQHFSGRSAFDRNRTLWSSWVIEAEKHKIFFSGDTGLSKDFEIIREKKGPSFDLIMLEVGAFHPAWGDIHLGPENALIAHQMLGGGTFLPVHWGTFDLGLHAWEDPIEKLVKNVRSEVHLVTPRLGRPIEPSQVERIDRWWIDQLSPQLVTPQTTAAKQT